MKKEITGATRSIFLQRQLLNAVADKLKSGNLSRLVQKLLAKWVEGKVEVEL